MLARHDIYTLVDFHVDALAPPWGFGWPEWARTPGGTTLPDWGFPQILSCWLNLTRTDICVALESFWKDAGPFPVGSSGNTLKRIYADMVRYVVAFLIEESNFILGYDVMNEPASGFAYRDFDQILSRFYADHVVPAIRSVDEHAIVWLEPDITFGVGQPTSLDLKTFGGNVGFTFHNYDVSNFKAPFHNAIHIQAPRLMGEFGATVNNTTLVETVANLADDYMIPWSYWSYFNNPTFFINSTAIPVDNRRQGLLLDFSKPRTPPNLNINIIQSLTCVYPRYVAGTPHSYRFYPLVRHC